MYRIWLQNNEYRNLDLSEAEFVSIATGAAPDFGVAVWVPDQHEYVSNISAEAAVQLYPLCHRDSFA